MDAKTKMVGLALTDEHVRKLHEIDSRLPKGKRKQNLSAAARTLIDLGHATYKASTVSDALDAQQKIQSTLAVLKVDNSGGQG